MPTIEDLHAAFAELERQAPEALSQPVRATHRGRWVAAGLAAACTAAVAIAVPLAVHGSGSGTAPVRPAGPKTPIVTAGVGHAFSNALPGPEAGHSPELTYGFAIPGTVAGYTVQPDEITRSYQHASIYGPTDPPAGQVFVYYRNAFDPAGIADRDGVTVDGLPGYYGLLQLPGGVSAVPVLAWEYASGGWAVIRLGVDLGNPAAKDRSSAERHAAESEAQSARVAENALQLAEAMVPARTPLHSPVQLPGGAGLSVHSMSSDASPEGSIVLAGAGDTTYTIGWGPDALHAADKPNTATTHVGGHDWIVYSDGSYGLVADHFGMTVVATTSAGIVNVRHFVTMLTVAQGPADRSAWFEANSALP